MITCNPGTLIQITNIWCWDAEKTSAKVAVLDSSNIVKTYKSMPVALVNSAIGEMYAKYNEVCLCAYIFSLDLKLVLHESEFKILAGV